MAKVFSCFELTKKVDSCDGDFVEVSLFEIRFFNFETRQELGYAKWVAACPWILMLFLHSDNFEEKPEKATAELRVSKRVDEGV